MNLQLRGVATSIRIIYMIQSNLEERKIRKITKMCSLKISFGFVRGINMIFGLGTCDKAVLQTGKLRRPVLCQIKRDRRLKRATDLQIVKN